MAPIPSAGVISAQSSQSRPAAAISSPRPLRVTKGRLASSSISTTPESSSSRSRTAAVAVRHPRQRRSSELDG